MKGDLALAWYGLMGKDKSHELYSSITFAKTTSEVKIAIEKADAISLSFVFGTVRACCYR